MKSKDGSRLRRLAYLLLIAIIILFWVFTPRVASQVTETAPPQKNIEITATKIEPILLPVIEKEPQLPSVFIDIGWCESRNNQSRIGLNYRYKTITLEDGTKKKVRTDEVWSRDIGKYQINEYYHLERSKKLGLDIYTEEGNTAYAFLLYNENGTSDWNASKACWADVGAWKAKHKQPFYQ